MSRASENEQERIDNARNGMKRDGYVECLKCGHLFAPISRSEEETHICNDCFQRELKKD